MKPKIQITLAHLQNLISKAEKAKELDNSLSNTLVFELIEEIETYLSSDIIKVTLKSCYSECIGKLIE